MITYVYEYVRYGKGEMIAKYMNGYVYDLRGKQFESSGEIIGKVIDNYLFKGNNYGYEPPNIQVSGNILYRRGATYKEPLLIAKNNVIYAYNNYKLGTELAEYEGNTEKALLAYAALRTLGTASSINTITASTSTTTSSSGRNSYTSTPGDGFIAFIAFGGFFGIIIAMSLCISFYEYYTFLHVGIPALILIGIVGKRFICEEEHEYRIGSVLLNAILGIGIGLLTIFFVSPIDMVVMRYMNLDRTLIIDRDTAYTACFILVILITIISKAKRKK